MNEMKERPRILKGNTYRVKTGCGNLYITINFDENNKDPFEIFIQGGRSGGCFSSITEMVARLTSVMFRHGITIDSVIKQLKGINCNYRPVFDNVNDDEHKTAIISCGDAIAKILTRFAIEELGRTDLLPKKS